MTKFHAASLIVLAAATGSAEPPQGESDRKTETRGARLYRLHCAACHGTEGRGDGPVAGDLETKPLDLRRIAKRRGGLFPAEEIADLIDGRRSPAVHGASQMPIWGLSFRQGSRLEDQDAEVAEQIDELVHHLRSLQIE